MKPSAADPEKTLCVLVNREIRKIPAGWVHPIDGQGRPIPLSPDDMPEVIGLDHRQVRLCVYETTTDGTPCSPAYPDSPAGRRGLLEHCVRHVPLFAAHKGSRREWSRILFQRRSVVVEIAKRSMEQKPW